MHTSDLQPRRLQRALVIMIDSKFDPTIPPSSADSQEKEAGDAAPGDLPKSSPPPKKKTIEPELVLVSSSGEPSGPKRHVSLKILALRL
jgi:hypothetical protein